jgi:hypothetical protein
VSEIVQPHGREPGSPNEALERVRVPVRVQVLPVASVADEVGVVPGTADEQPSLGLLPAVTSQALNDEGRQRDRPAAPVGLGRDQHGLPASRLLQCREDAQDARVQINRRPPHAEDLPPTHASGGGDQQRHLVHAAA